MIETPIPPKATRDQLIKIMHAGTKMEDGWYLGQILALVKSDLGAAFGVPGYLPDLMIPAGWSWSTATSAMDAGDQFDQIILLVQRFPNDAASISAEQ